MVPAVLAALLAGGAGIVSTALGVRESRKNREWQEEMSNTAHQREVADMTAARLNPALSAMRGGGASTPSGNVGDFSGLERGVSNALAAKLAVKQAEANIVLTNAQAASTNALTNKTNAEATDLVNTRQARYDVSMMTRDQMRQQMPILLEQARAQVQATAASARNMSALAVLSELEKTGAANLQKFEETVGAMGPAGKALLEILRAFRRPR